MGRHFEALGRPSAEIFPNSTLKSLKHYFIVVIVESGIVSLYNTSISGVKSSRTTVYNVLMECFSYKINHNVHVRVGYKNDLEN